MATTLRHCWPPRARQHRADWSPAGRQYVYVTESSGAPEIWMRTFGEGWAGPLVHQSDDGNLEPCLPSRGYRRMGRSWHSCDSV